MEFKDNNDLINMFSILWDFCSKESIELYTTFDQTSKEIIVLMHKLISHIKGKIQPINYLFLYIKNNKNIILNYLTKVVYTRYINR